MRSARRRYRRSLVLALLAGLVMAFTGVAARPSAATPVEHWQLNRATGHFYKQVGPLTWEAAEAYAVSVGGHLATVNDQAEQDWLAATFTQPNLWIGFNDRAVEGKWVWSSGEPVTYTNWVPFERDNCTSCGPPDGHGPLPQGEDAAVMNWTWTHPDGTVYFGWNDWRTSAPSTRSLKGRSRRISARTAAGRATLCSRTRATV